MTYDEFRASLSQDAPPPGLMPALQALWQDGKGDWHAAHTASQVDKGAEGAWVHAYLHRKEGDVSNAGYWYQRAGQPIATGPLEGEWEAIVRALLNAP